MTPTITVRPATGADVAVLVEFNLAMARESEDKGLEPARLRRGVASLLATPQDGFYLVADADGRPAGSLMVTFEWSDWRDGRFWWIQSVYVVPAARRGGVFRALYDHVATLARSTPGVVGLRLYVELDNESARRTYESCGMHDGGYRIMEVDHSGTIRDAHEGD